MIDRSCDWRAVEWDPAEKVAYGITCGSGSLLFRFDPHQEKKAVLPPWQKCVTVSFLIQAGKIFPIQPLPLPWTAGTKRSILFPQPGNIQPVNMLKPSEADKPHHLIMYDIKSDKRTDLGEMKTSDGRRIFGCEAASVARRWNGLYMWPGGNAGSGKGNRTYRQYTCLLTTDYL